MAPTGRHNIPATVRVARKHRLAGRSIPFALALTWAVPAAAEWTSAAFDNGAWFEASVGDGRGISLGCGGRSPTGQPLPATDEPNLTGPWQLDLLLEAPPMPRGADGAPTPGDTMVVIGTAGYTLPALRWDVLTDDHWVQSLELGDGLVRALVAGPPVEVRLGGVPVLSLPGDGLADALADVVAFCGARWAALGLPPPPVSADMAPATAAAPSPASGLRAAVDAHVEDNCNGSFTASPGWLHAGEIDGDGTPDLVVAWDGVQCNGSLGRPYCGASQCAVDTFLSSVYPRTGAPESLYGAAVSLVQAPGGLAQLALVGRLATCGDAADPNDCIFYWGWDGSAFRRLK